MKMKVFILFFLCHIIAKAQTSDSLLFQLNSIENDTESVNQLYTQGFELRNSDPDNAWLFANACYKKALKSENQKHLAKAYNLLGVLHYKKTHYLKALEYQKKALNLNKQIGNKKGCAINLSNLGNIYSDINYFKQAESSYLEAIQINNSLGNTKEITRCLINIAALKHTLNQNDAAVSNLKQALFYANDLNNYDLIATCNNNIGIALTNQNKLDTALFYLQEALKMRLIIDDEVDLANSYINIANVLNKQKEINEAFYYIVMAESHCKRYEIYDELVNLYSIKSEWYESKNMYDSAIIYLKKHQQLKDSLQKIETENTDLLSNEDSISEIEIETNTSKLVVLVALFGLFLGSITSYFIFRKK